MESGVPHSVPGEPQDSEISARARGHLLHTVPDTGKGAPACCHFTNGFTGQGASPGWGKWEYICNVFSDQQQSCWLSSDCSMVRSLSSYTILQTAGSLEAASFYEFCQVFVSLFAEVAFPGDVILKHQEDNRMQAQCVTGQRKCLLLLLSSSHQESNPTNKQTKSSC